jgi:hypothetical protein
MEAAAMSGDWDLREALAELTVDWLRDPAKKIKRSDAIDGVRYVLFLDEQNGGHSPGPRVQAAQLLRNEADRIASRHPDGMNSDEFTVCTWLRHRANEIEDFGHTGDDVKGAGARFYPERLACSAAVPVEYVHIAEHHPERDADRLICGVHEYGRNDNPAVPCGPTGPFAHFTRIPGLRVVHHYVQGRGSIADCGRGFTGSGPEVGFTDDWSAVTCAACRQVYPDTKADPTPPVTFDIVSGPIVHAVMYRDHHLGTLCQSGAYGNPELYTAVIEHVTCPACREKLEGNRAAESTENRGSNPR